MSELPGMWEEADLFGGETDEIQTVMEWCAIRRWGDPPRPRPLSERELASTWVLRFGDCAVEYELLDSPSGRGLACSGVGRVGPSFWIGDQS